MGIYYYLLLSYELKFLRFQQSKTSVVNAIKYVCSLTCDIYADTPA